MADRNKFEEMLERLINEDKEGAEELFHEIVVEKSRDIYESLLETDLEEIDEESDEEVDEAADEEEVEESTDEEDEDEEVEENFNLDEFEVEGDDEMGGDPTDDMMADIEGGDEEGGEEGEEEGEEGELEDRVVDLEDALDDLKAEFEKMMAGEEGEEHDMGGDEGEEGGEEAGDEEEAPEESLYFGEETDEEEVEESKQPKSDIDVMKEYVQKVTAKMGDNGANTKSTVAGKNDMGGTAGNIAQGGEESGRKADSAKEDNAGNVNVPGGKASKSMKAQPKGHGAEKKGAGETAANKTPVIGK